MGLVPILTKEKEKEGTAIKRISRVPILDRAKIEREKTRVVDIPEDKRSVEIVELPEDKRSVEIVTDKGTPIKKPEVKPILDLNLGAPDTTSNTTPERYDGVDTLDVAKAVAKAVVQAPQRALTSVLLEPAAGIIGLTKGEAVRAEFVPKSKIEKIIFGEEPVTGMFTKSDEFRKELKKKLKEQGLAPGLEGPIAGIFAPIFTAGMIGLDLSPIGGQKNVAKLLAKADNIEDVTKILKATKVSDEIAEVIAPRLVKETSEEAINNVLKNLDGFTKITNKAEAPKIKIKNISTAQALRKAESINVPAKTPKTLPVKTVDSARKVVRRETTLLKDRLRNISRGAREGSRSAKQTIKEIQGDLIDVMRRDLPVITKADLSAIRNTNTPESLIKQLDRVEQKAIKLDQIKVLEKELKTAKQKITYIRKVGDLSQLLVTDARKSLKIDVPVSKMNKAQLDTMITELKTRMAFRRQRGIKPKEPQITDAPDPNKKEFDDNFYAETVAQTETRGEKIMGTASKTLSDIKEGISDTLEMSLTRLSGIDSSLSNRAVQFEFDIRQAKLRDSKRAMPALEKMDKMASDDLVKLDMAMKNGDSVMIDKMSKKYDLRNELKELREMLDDAYVRGNDVGLDIQYNEDFFPRLVGDSKGLVKHFYGTENWSIIDRAIRERGDQLGRSLDFDEQAEIINKLTRGFKSKNISLSIPGALKARTIDYVTPEINKYYKPTSEAIINYIDTVNDAIEARRFFGKQLKMDEKVLGEYDVKGSIGAYTAKLLQEGKLNADNELVVRKIFQARFNEKGPGRIVSGMKNLAYISTMKSFKNAVTQIGDLGFAIYKTGLTQTGKSLGKTLTGKNLIDHKKDLGVDKMGHEYAGSGFLSRWVTLQFKAIGVEGMDAIGKRTLIDAVMSQMSNQAKVNDPKLTEKLVDIFGNRAPLVKNSLKNGELTEDIKLLAFQTLTDFQPVTLFNMPVKYLEGGNARAIYMLKTFTLQMFTVFQRDAFRLMKDPETRLEGVKNMVKLSVALMAMNASADYIKDFMSNRKTEVEDVVVDNIAKLFGVNKYTLDSVSRQGLGDSVLKTIAPPMQPLNVVSDLYKDFKKNESINSAKSIKNIPIAGDLYYYWFGKGATKTGVSKPTSTTIKPIKIKKIKVKPIKVKKIKVQ